jgi:hypothetical protein
MTKARDLASAAPAPSTVSATEIGYLDGVSSAIQTQIDGKSGTSHNHNSDYIAKTLTTTTGDIIYASSANTPARLGIGSTSQVLTVSGGIPAWATPAAGGGGKVLQVVQGTSTASVTHTTMTPVDTTLSATITPSSANSKILVMFSQMIGSEKNQRWTAGTIHLLRTGNIIHNGGDGIVLTIVSPDPGTVYINAWQSRVYLDSPSTTSAITYKTQCAVVGDNNFQPKVYLNGSNNNAVAHMILMEIGA